MQKMHERRIPGPTWLPILAALVVSLSWKSAADQVETQNGDRYYGKVVSLNADTLVIQSDVLGTVRVPRGQVAHITLGNLPATSSTRPATNVVVPRPAAATATNRAPDLMVMRNQLSTNSNLIQQVEAQFLAGADPAAKAKFNELLGGYLSGKLNINDIRAQAQAASDQIKSMRKDLGSEADIALDGYLAILDQFLKETAPAAGAGTNSARTTARSKPGGVSED